MTRVTGHWGNVNGGVTEEAQYVVRSVVNVAKTFVMLPPVWLLVTANATVVTGAVAIHLTTGEEYPLWPHGPCTFRDSWGTCMYPRRLNATALQVQPVLEWLCTSPQSPHYATAAEVVLLSHGHPNESYVYHFSDRSACGEHVIGHPSWGSEEVGGILALMVALPLATAFILATAQRCCRHWKELRTDTGRRIDS